MVISVHKRLFCVLVLLFGISPIGGFAGEQSEGVKRYGPIGSNETLTEIALKLRGDGPWHYQRWMYALYRKNPQAFFDDNMNNLKLNAILEIPVEEELKQIDLTEAFRAVKVQLYMLQQVRREKLESDNELLLRARLQRLFTTNEMVQKESGALFERISVLEQQMDSVVDQVLESEKRVDDAQPPAAPSLSSQVESESFIAPWGWFALLGIMFIYVAGFIWRRRAEAAL